MTFKTFDVQNLRGEFLGSYRARTAKDAIRRGGTPMTRIPYSGAPSRAAPQRDRPSPAMTGQTLYYHLSMLGITHMRFASLVGCDGRTVRRWCSGESPVPESIARVVRMAEAGDLSLDALYAYRSSNFERPVDSEGGAVDEKPQIR